MSQQLDRFCGCLVGLSVGDAVGASVETYERGSFNVIEDMIGGGPFKLRAGQWTDDTSMALCLATSLLECAGFDAKDQMNRYCRWVDDGYLSSTGSCFDIGTTCDRALALYSQTGDPFAGDLDSAANGSIMRLAPIPMYYWSDGIDAILHYSAESSRTTHATLECLDACRLLGLILYKALSGQRKEDLLAVTTDHVSCSTVRAIANATYRNKSEHEISTTGYVIDTLEAAMWCFAMTGSFQSAVLTATNLGGDADTTAAVCGQIAGAFYGVSGIPAHWRQRLAMESEILKLATRLHAVQGTKK